MSKDKPLSGYCPNYSKRNKGHDVEPIVDIPKTVKGMNNSESREFFCLGCNRRFRLTRITGSDKSFNFANDQGQFEELDEISIRQFNDNCEDYLELEEEKKNIFDEL